jgi:HEAT repeat protein
LLQCKLLPVATRLAEDRAASVRLAVAAQCDRLCSALGEHWCSVIIDLLQALVKDSDERVRSEATLCLPRLVENLVMGSIEAQTKYSVSVVEMLLPTMLKCVGDPASSVRAALATASGELLALFAAMASLEHMEGVTNPELISELKMNVRHVDETLIPLLQKLLNDKDPEVTSAALRAVTNASRGSVKPPCVHHEVMNGGSMSPQRKLSFDQKEHHHRKSSDHQPVFKPVLSEGQVLKLLPTLSDLSNSSQWRVRQSAVEIVPALLGCTQRLETRSAIAQLCVTLMGDVVDTVRRTAAECLCLGGGSLGGDGGGEWLREIVIPNLKLCRDSETSKQRMLCLKMVEVLVRSNVCVDALVATTGGKATSWRKLGPAPSSTTPLREVLELGASLANDKVVNVRLNVGRVLGVVVDDLTSEDDIKFVIQTLEDQMASEQERERSDRDVLYFARGAILRSQAILEGHVSEPSTPTFSRPKTSITI